MKRITSIITFLFCAFIGSFSFGQSYPVQTNIHLTGPFTNHIPDYLDPGNSKFQVALQITDANIGVLNVRLKLKLTGPNGEMVTRSTYAPPMVTLNYGVPTILDGSDLASYFDVNNLTFSNSQIQTAYTNTSNLQEGFWTWCVEVYDATNPTAEVLSTNNCHITFIATNLPPITNLPLCGAVLPHEPTVLFNWSIMPSVLPEGAVETFTFQLYAIPIASYVNVSQVLSMSPIFWTSLPAGTSTYVLNTNEVLLSPQFHYVWRVHVNNGVSGNIPNSSSYMNNGFSVPCDFMLENNDQIAINSLELALTSVATGTTTGKSTWTVTDTENNNNQFDGFILAYRKAGNPDYTWYEQDVVAFEYNLTQLEANTTYETKIKGYIGNEESEYTEIVTFTTNPEPVLACGQGVLPTLPSTYEPLHWLQAFPGIQVTQGQFTMMVTSISPVVGADPGHFKGTGFMYIPFLHFAMQVHFDDLEIDDQKVARSGDVKVVSQGLDAWLDSQYAAEVTPVNINGVISSYTFNEPFTSVSVVINGVTTIYTVTDPLPTILQDDDNKEYQFWPDGRVIVKPYGIVPSNDHLAITTDKMVNFIDSEDQAYPTDVKEYAHLAENYECIIEGEIKYFVANKSALSGATDLVKAKVHIVDNFDRALLSFRLAFSNDTITYTYNPSDSTCTFSIPEKTSNYSLYAYYGTAKVGKLNVKVYDEVTKKVRIVPLMSVANIAGFTEQNIESTLNSIYRGAHVKIDATIAAPFNTDVFTSTLEFANPDVQGMSFYTAQMKALREAYIAGPGAEMPSDEYLVFVIPKFANSQIDGYMVRGRALGFVTLNSPTILRTLAHELGHGIGGLQHNWESDDQIGKTKNLMDYDPDHDTKLIAKQWKDLNTAPLILNFLDDEEDFLSKLTPGVDKLGNEIFEFTHLGWIPFSALVESDVFRADNGAYFQIPTGRNVSRVLVANGYIKALDIEGLIYYIHTSSRKIISKEDDIATPETVNVGPELADLVFKKPGVVREQLKAKLSNGEMFEGEPFIAGVDYFVTTGEQKKCKDFQKYISSYTPTGGKVYSDKICEEEEPVTACVESSISNKSAISELDQTKINEALANVVTAAGIAPLPGSSYTSFDPQIDLTDNNFLSQQDRAVLFEKINLLHDYRSNKIMAYVFLESEDQSLYTTEQLATMAQTAVSSVITTPVAGDKNIALLIINTQKYLEDGWINPSSNCFRLNFYSNDPTFIDPSTTVSTLIGSPYKAILRFYASLKKPLRRINIYTKYDYTGAHIVMDKTADPSFDKYGLPYIHFAKHLKSKNLEVYQSILDAQCLGYHKRMSDAESLPDAQKVVAEQEALNYWNAAEEYRLEYKATFDLRDRFNVKADWIEGEVKFDNIKERKLSLAVAQAEFKSQIGGGGFIQSVLTATGNNGVLQTDTYYSFDVAGTIIDPVVYGFIDLVGVVPGVDYFADAAGLAYAGLRLDGNQVVIYSAALATPFVGAAVFHTVKKIRMYVKKTNGTFETIAAEISDPTLTNVVPISDEVDVLDDELTEALNGLNEPEVIEQVDENTMRRAKKILNEVEDLIESVNVKLLARNLSQSNIDDIIIRAMYIDDKIGSNKMMMMLDDIVGDVKFKNPEDLLDNLTSVYSGNDVNTFSAKNLLNEFKEGKYWIDQDNEVYISKKWSGNADEVDVTITTSSTLVECKNIISSSPSGSAVRDNINLIIEKYTNPAKLSEAVKSNYPNHFGKINISSISNPYYNLSKEEFILKIRTDLFPNVGGSGIDENLLKDAVKELHVENGKGRFVILANEW